MPLPKVQQVVKDPDFLALPDEEKHRVLAQIDPEYGNLPQEEQGRVLSSFSRPTSQVPRGGVGREMSRDEARDIASERLVRRAREAGQDNIVTGREIGHPEAMFATPTGLIPQTSAFAREFARNVPGSLSEPVLAGSEKLANLAGLGEQARMFGRENLAKENPIEAASGGLAAMIAPAKKIGSRIIEQPTGRQLFSEGAKLGGAIGGTRGLSESVAQGESPLDVLGETAKGTIGGALLGGGLSMVPGAVKGVTTAVQNRARTPNRIIADLVDAPNAAQNVKDAVQNGYYSEVIPLLEPLKKTSGAKGLVEASGKAISNMLDTVQPVIKAADTEAFTGMGTEVEERLANMIAEPESRAAALKSVRKYIENVTPENATGIAKDLNRGLGDFYSGNRINEASDNILAEKAVRDVLSQRIKGVLEGQGVDPKLYSQTGRIAELQDIIGSKYQKAFLERESMLGKGLSSTLETPYPTKLGIISKAYKGAKEFFGSGEAERINKQVDRLFNMTEGKQIPTLSDAERSLLLKQEADRLGTAKAKSDLQSQFSEEQAAKNAESATPEDLNNYRNEMAQAERDIMLKRAAADLTKGAQKGASAEMKSIANEKAANSAEPASAEDLNAYRNQMAQVERDIRLKRAAEDFQKGAQRGASSEMKAISKEKDLGQLSEPDLINKLSKDFLHEFNPEIAQSIKSEAGLMAAEVRGGEAGKRVPKLSMEDPFSTNPEMVRGERGYEFTGIPSTYPEWYGELHASRERVLSALEKIVKDNGVDKGKLVENIKRLIAERKLKGFSDKEFGIVPPDEEFLKAVGQF